MTKPCIVLVGNPNCGKTALFNALTGSRQKVGNWPGVTVDKKLGHLRLAGGDIMVVDLPGIYSFSVNDETAIDAKIACEFLAKQPVDVVVNVIDGSNLERNLYLTLQLLALSIPVVLAVNMLDVVEKRGLSLDLAVLEKILQCKVVGLTASKKQGIQALKNTLTEVLFQPMPPIIRESLVLNQLPEIFQTAYAKLVEALIEAKVDLPDWLALRLLEADVLVSHSMSPRIQALSTHLSLEILQKTGFESDLLLADARYEVANQTALQVTKIQKAQKTHASECLDKIVLNRFLGIPIFLGVMYFMFLFAINIGGAFQDFFDFGSSAIFVDGLAQVFTKWHCPTWLIALLADGLGKGINTTLTFIPVIGAMFLFLSFLEDSGYMVRAAFVVDRLMNAMGLPGKAFVPMIVGFGCNVPAVMGARTLANRRDRILAVMMMPFMSCGARLAIFAVFAAAFFQKGGQDIIFALYLFGILVAILTGLLLRVSFLKGKPAPLVMELPAYHWPQVGSLLQHTWSRLKSFLYRAGKIIVPVCLVVGALNSISFNGVLAKNRVSDHSILSSTGRVITPILAPMGVHTDNWPATVGLMTGVLAKEVVVGTLNTLYSQQGHLLAEKAEQFHFVSALKAAVMSVPENLAGLKDAWQNPILASESPTEMNHQVYGFMYQRFQNKSAAFAYLMFVLLYFPCISTMAAMRREIGSGWTYFSMGWSFFVAYTSAVFSYQALTFSLHPASALTWMVSIVLGFAVVVVGMRIYSRSS